MLTELLKYKIMRNSIPLKNTTKESGMRSKLMTLALLATMGSAQAATIAIVDSGSDLNHKDLKAKAWLNTREISDNNRDDDKNGYPDDMNGWNFAEANNQLIDYSYSWSDTADVRRFFDVQLKSFLGTITAEDKAWANAKFQEEKFLKDISVFGNWMHGTHVMGIAAKHSANAKMMGVKLIPTEVKLPGKESTIITISTDNQIARFDTSDVESRGFIKDALVKKGLKTLAVQQAAIYGEIGSYLKGHNVDVMNGSFGTGYGQIKEVIGQLVASIFKSKPSESDLKKYTDYFFSVAVEEAAKFAKASPNTLFVFAAGNDGSNNDIFPTTPANIVADNKITVAATLDDKALANFSNYGVNNVEVAAPGVGILSQSPMDSYIHVSGTSQAAPYVAGIAGAVKDANNKLGYKEIKKIILETVDVKPWLKGYVKTSGLVNAKRAIYAAQLSNTMSVEAAIAQSKTAVTLRSEDKGIESFRFQIPNAWVMPLPSTIVVR